jgi:hypothetical protein
MAELRHDLAHLDTVEIPDYTPDWARPPRMGPLPSVKAASLAVAAVFSALTALGVLAEVLHRNLPPR